MKALPADFLPSTLNKVIRFVRVRRFMSLRPLLILFVSTGNAARSSMAEAFLNAKGSEAYRARSAGVAPWGALAPRTKSLLEDAGYQTHKLYPKKWQDFYAAAHLVKVDMIITLSQEAHDLLPLDWPHDPVRAHWLVDDPLASERADVQEWKFRKCYATLEARVATLVRCRPAASASEWFVRLKEIGMVV